MLLLACAAIALVALPAASASAEQAAIEEYVLTLPGVDRAGPATTAPIVVRSQRAGPVGVVGEDEAPISQLGAISSAISAPAGIGIAVVLVLGAGFLVRRRSVSR